jgi:hypothetical protein
MSRERYISKQIISMLREALGPIDIPPKRVTDECFPGA